MIIVMGYLRLSEGGGARMKTAFEAIIEGTRAEPDCDHYALAPDLFDPDLIHVSERWMNQEALGRHLVSDHVVNLQLAMRRTRVLAADVNIYYRDGTVKRMINVDLKAR